ncbi:MAG TPA: pseudouridine synthase, partial [Acholeplasmataceae bacterium]|nr:pseudouridine synthase [Acholeplasmataceae bacterium]
PRPVEIYAFNYEINDTIIDFNTHVSKGTYIRSIARDIGLKLNTYGALKTLRRTAIGNYAIEHAKTLTQLLETDLIDHRLLFKNIPKLKLNDYLIKLVKNGVKLDERQITTDKPFVVVDQLDQMIAYYVPDNNAYKVKYFF